MCSHEKSGNTGVNHALTLCLEQEGSEEDDDIWAVAGGADESVVLAGYTMGNWNATNEGALDYAIVKLDSEGNVLCPGYAIVLASYGRRLESNSSRRRS